MKIRFSVWTGVAAMLALAMFAPPAQAQSVVGTPHDLSSNLPAARARVCVFCHTPHQPDAPFFDVDPLWNHTLSLVAAYGVYASPTFQGVASIADIGGGTTVSNLCLSCHDGTIGIGSLYNDPNDGLGGEDVPANAATVMVGNALVGTNLTNDHPVNFDYDNALFLADTELVDPTNAAVAPLLFGGTVQCASCHDPHDNTNTSFLVTTNVGSALCLTCHVK